MALWDKSREECEQIIEKFIKNVEANFGKVPDKAGIALMLETILDEKLYEFTRQTFTDLTPHTLIACGRILKEEPRVQLVHDAGLTQKVNKSKQTQSIKK